MGTAITKVTTQSSPKKHHCSLGYRLPIRLQARAPGYSQRPSVTKDRLWLQVPDLVLKLYHSFPLFPKILLHAICRRICELFTKAKIHNHTRWQQFIIFRWESGILLSLQQNVVSLINRLIRKEVILAKKRS